MSETQPRLTSISKKEKPMDLFDKFDSFQDDMERLNEHITFDDYLNKVVKNPQLVRSAYRTVYDAVTTRPDFFQSGNNALYGAEETTNEFIDVLRAGAEGHEVGKRIILLLGPPGSGKSTLVNGTKRAVEEYSKTEEGALYAISDCPMQEEPMHLIPKDMRPMLEEEYGIRVDGDLCPHCEDKYGSQLREGKSEALKAVDVKRVVFSEKNRSGIGTFKPSDPKSQDITELTGSPDLSKIGEYGSQSDSRAFRFDGELNVANRGVMEFVEMLKSDERFLYTLLDLSQDRVIKAPRFANISADEVIIAHTNLAEYKRYVGDERNEALKDRLRIIPVPYSLKVSEERRIYDKLLSQSERVKNSGVHVSPTSLDVAATFSVLSRLKPVGKYDKLDKLHVYDGNETGSLTKRDLKEILKANKENGLNEGMSGISPRFIIDSLSMMLSREGGTKECLTPIDTIRALRDNIDSHSHTRDMKKEDKEALLDDIDLVKENLDKSAKNEVRNAFIDQDMVQAIGENYLSNVAAFCNNDKMIDPLTGEEVSPDEELMRSLEEQINVSENGKKEFRNEVLMNMAQALRRGDDYDATSHPRLKHAIENKLYEDMKSTIDLAIGTRTPNGKQKKRIDRIIDTLVEEHGYCEHCASELIRYVGMLNRAA